MQLKLFYRWVDKIDLHTIPDEWRWYEPITNKAKRINLNPKDEKTTLSPRMTMALKDILGNITS
jgi:hypothetical protein